MDWVTASALATAAGTLVLAAATFLSTRSANRAARAAERSLLAGLRPLLIPSTSLDPEQKVGFVDQKWLRVGGGRGAAEVTDEAVYLAISLRNVGTGIGVLHGWQFIPDRPLTSDMPDPAGFTRLSRDLYLPVGEVGFWQGSFRDPSQRDFAAAREVVRNRGNFTVDLLYGDFEGGQRMISRFALAPLPEDGWIASVGRHWNVDRPQPR